MSGRLPVACARAVFALARRNRLPGEPMESALLRALYTLVPEEERARRVSIFAEGDRGPGETDAQVVARLADRLFL